MKNVLNAVSAILIILFLGWQFCGDCCEKKCDYSKCEKSGETKKECPHSNINDVDGGDDADGDDGDDTDGVDADDTDDADDADDAE